MTSKDQPKRALADDPVFLSSLSELDRGIGGADEPPRGTPPARLPGAASPQFQDAHAPSTPSGVADIPLVITPGRRPLLDLFPIFPSASEPLGPPPVSDRFREAPAESAPPPAAPLTSELFYGLNEHPFSPISDLKFLYHSAAHDRVAQELLGAIERRDAFAVVTAPAGMGKTLLCRAIIQQLDRRTLTSFVTDPPASIEDLLKTVLADFGVMSREDLARAQLLHASPQELTDALRTFLFSLVALQAFAVVIIDDADRLAPGVLDQLGSLMDTATGGTGDEIRLLQVILVGRPELATRLQGRALYPLMQRAAVRTTLEPLASDEVAGYVLHRLSVAGTGSRLDFDDAAVARLYELSRGVPKVVSSICERALAEGYRLSTSVIDEPLIDAAAQALDLAPPASPASTVGRAALVAATLVLLGLGGATAAAFAFRADVSAIVIRWQAIPPPPRRLRPAPPAAVPPIVVPVPAPEPP